MRIEHSYGIIIYSYINEAPVYLFLSRREGWYDFPKGHIEAGETGTMAALRETYEESGIKLSEDQLIPFFSHDIEYNFTYNGIKIEKHVEMYMAHVNNVEVKVSSEHTGYKWLSFEDAMSILKFNNQKELLSFAEKYRIKFECMAKLNEEYGELYKTPDWKLSKNFVPGTGNLCSKIMVIGQAPGKNEDIQKKPFVGRSGQLLDNILMNAGINRNDIYITSVVQFFPPSNRIPDKKEISLCLPYLKKQIEIIDPDYIILLGRVAAGSLCDIENIMNSHGKIIDGKYFITFHPAAGLRNPEFLKLMQDDLLKFQQIIKAGNI